MLHFLRYPRSLPKTNAQGVCFVKYLDRMAALKRRIHYPPKGLVDEVDTRTWSVYCPGVLLAWTMVSGSLRVVDDELFLRPYSPGG